MDSRKQKCCKRPLYDAFNKYGIENFSIELIEEVQTDKEACEREQFWIQKLNTYIGFPNSNGYNATLGGDSKQYYDYKEIALKFIELDNNQIKTAQFFNCDIFTVRKACQEYSNMTNYKPNYRHKQKVKMIDSQNNEIIFDSVTEAALFFKDKNPETARKNISRAINKGSIAYGYHFIKI